MDYIPLGNEFERLMGQLQENLFAFLPKLLGAIFIIFIGILLAYLLRAIIQHLTKRLDQLATDRIRSGLSRIGIKNSASEMVGNIVFWIILLFCLTIATETLGLPVVTTWLSGIALYLPRILAAILICIVGLGGSVLLRDIILRATTSAGIMYGHILAKLSQTAVVLVSVLIAIEHIGIGISVITGIITIVIGAILFGMALAFGLGARTSISNILASHYIQKTYRVGHTIKIENTTGRIVQITPTAVIIENDKGQTHVPANTFSTAMSSLVLREER